MYVFLLDLYQEVELLGHRICISLALGDASKQQTDFPNGYLNLVSHKQCKTVLVTPYSHQHPVFPSFLNILMIMVCMQ